jgi:hypothetical protein
MKRIGKIENYYGGLYVKEVENKYYWTIEDYFGNKWEEISETLYNELLKHETIK